MPPIITMKSASMLESNDSKGLSGWGSVQTAVLLSGAASVASPAGLSSVTFSEAVLLPTLVSVTLERGPASTVGGLRGCPFGHRVITIEAPHTILISTCG